MQSWLNVEACSAAIWQRGCRVSGLGGGKWGGLWILC